jgi:hypothetical protein
MADTLGSATREVGVAKSTILRLIRPSAPASNSETAALRAECEGLRLALSLTQEALREAPVARAGSRVCASMYPELSRTAS